MVMRGEVWYDVTASASTRAASKAVPAVLLQTPRGLSLNIAQGRPPHFLLLSSTLVHSAFAALLWWGDYYDGFSGAPRNCWRHDFFILVGELMSSSSSWLAAWMGPVFRFFSSFGEFYLFWRATLVVKISYSDNIGVLQQFDTEVDEMHSILQGLLIKRPTFPALAAPNACCNVIPLPAE